MMTFLICAGLMTLLLLVIIMIPLLSKQKKIKADTSTQASLEVYRDQFKELEDELSRGAITQKEYDDNRSELERRVLEDTAPIEVELNSNPKVGTYTTIMLFLFVPLFAAFVWIITQPLGDYRLDGGKYEGVMDYNNGGGQAQGEMHDMDQAIANLRQHLTQNPGDIEGWMMYGRTMLTTRRYSEAVQAFEKANQLAPGNPTIMVDLADAVAMVQGQDLDGRPWELVNRALKIDPTNWKALAMAGTDKFNHKDYRQAIMYWERLLRVLPPGDGMQQSVLASIQEARDLGGIVGPVKDTLQFGTPVTPEQQTIPSMMKESLQPMGQTPVPQQPEEKPRVVTHTISGIVEIDPKLLEKMGDRSVLYVTARPASGGRMPIVQHQIAVLDFPVHFKIDNTMLPPMDMGAGTLDKHEMVLISARLGYPNRAMPQDGDLEGISAKPVPVNSDNVQVVLDKVIKK